jgi:hypothetical protein
MTASERPVTLQALDLDLPRAVLELELSIRTTVFGRLRMRGAVVACPEASIRRLPRLSARVPWGPIASWRWPCRSRTRARTRSS